MENSASSDTLPVEQIEAVIYGQCVGDTIGLLTEFMTKKEAEMYFKTIRKNLEFEHKQIVGDMHRIRWAIGDWTDDSDQMILIMQSIIDNEGKVDFKDFAKRIIKWKKEGFKELGDFAGMGIGSTTHQTLTRPNYLEDPHEAAEFVWNSGGKVVAPNGAVMRTSIVGCHCFWDINQVMQNAINICKTTHADPRCQASTVAVSCAIALMLQKKHYDPKKKTFNVKEIIKECHDLACECLETEQQHKELKTFMKCKDLKDLKLDEPKKIGYTYKCMGSGFYALKQSEFRKTIQDIVMEGGDADTNACVAGAMLACKLGIEHIPDTWRNGLRHKSWLDDHITKFLDVQRKLKAPKEAAASGTT